MKRPILTILATFALVAGLFAASKKVSEYSAATSLADGDLLFTEAADGLANNKVPWSLIKQSISTGLTSIQSGQFTRATIPLGTGTNVVIDPAYDSYIWFPTASCRFAFGTNSITDTNIERNILITIVMPGAGTLTNVTDALRWKGLTGSLSTGTNEIYLKRQGGIWSIDQDTARMGSDQIEIGTTQRLLGRNTAGAGAAELVTLSQLLDWVGSAAQGDILYRNSSAWVRLAAGTSGYSLKSQGPGADLVWGAAGGGGGWPALGVTDGSDATTGYVGEYLSSPVTLAAGVALTTATSANIATIAITPGDWDFSGVSNFSSTGASTGSYGFVSVISLTSATTMGTTGNEVYNSAIYWSPPGTHALTLPTTRISTTTNATVYLVGRATFSSGTFKGWGSLSGRRVR